MDHEYTTGELIAGFIFAALLILPCKVVALLTR